MGDPAGIGPEVVLKAATVRDVRASARLALLGDPNILRRAAADMSINIRVVEVENVAAAAEIDSTDAIGVIPLSRVDDPAFDWGRPVASTDAAQVDYVRSAFSEVFERRQADAIVTAPISKAALHRAGANWPGHTEMLAEWSGNVRPIMMLAGPTLKVVPLTTHMPLSQVVSMVTEDRVRFALETIDKTFRRYFSRPRARIAVAGLNPHAGEGGLFGPEEETILAPAIAAAKEMGIDAQGPFPADSVFHRAVTGEFDVVLGMYHDQALIPLKLLDFDQAVNVTLGLPIIRTSVDHGTAYDIAGRGVASASSLIAAIRLAAEMAQSGASS